MKRRLTLFVPCIALTLSACGGGEDGNDASSGATPQSSQQTQSSQITSTSAATWATPIRDTAPTGTGCFESSYGQSEWTRVDCNAVSGVSTIFGSVESVPAVKYYETAVTNGGQITAVNSIVDYLVGTVSDPVLGAGSYSYQINTNFIQLPADSSLCTGDTECIGMEQFTYQNYGTTGFLSIWWIIINSSCPAAWNGGQEIAGSCYLNAGFSIPAIPVSNLAIGGGMSASVKGGIDTVTISANGVAYAFSIMGPFGEQWSEGAWQQAEANIFGTGNSSRVLWSAGSSLELTTVLTDGTNNVPNCNNITWTGESSSLLTNNTCTTSSDPPSVTYSFYS